MLRRSVEKPSSGFHARRLSYDHTAEDPSEQARIQAAGGFVTRGRVLGILAVARSFGDHGMKDFVLAQPHICEVNLDLKHHPFLILACDGACFWGYLYQFDNAFVNDVIFVLIRRLGRYDR